MKSRVAFLLLVLSLFTAPSFAYCIIKCDVRYLTVQQGGVTIESQGKYGLDVFGQRLTTYDWSNTYTVNVIFYSGSEANQLGYYYSENAIIALIRWSDGGYTVIQIQRWTTQLEVITEQELSYDTYGNKIEDISGIDTHETQWAIHLDN